MNAYPFSIPAVLLSLAAVAGCGSSRDVEVTGEIQSVSGSSIRLEFFEVTGEGADAVRESAYVATVLEPGAFDLMVPLEGDKVVIYALADADSNDQCDEGEAWTELEADVKDDKIEGISLELVVAECPAAAE